MMQHSGNPHGKSIDYNENPFIVIWEVTRACQLKCVHCRADAQVSPDPRELTRGRVEPLMRFMRWIIQCLSFLAGIA